MELVLGTHHLLTFGGADTYLLTVAQQLQALGHEVSVYAIEQGEMADIARARGVRVAVDRDDLPERCDGVLFQDAVTAGLLAQRYPDAPRVLVVHSQIFSLDMPPQVPGVADALVAMSDRVAEHLNGLAVQPEIVRLRQPIDTIRFSPAGPLRSPAERVLVLGNYLHGQRLEMLRDTCAELGLECTVIGVDSEPTPEPEAAMAEADIVVGKGRVILEAMACGRAAYVFDWEGGDGWVTPETYAALEADAFAGLTKGGVMDRARLLSELAAYDADMGLVNRELAVTHHAARDHARGLVDLFGRLAPSEPPPGTPLGELARLARQAWLSDSHRHQLIRQLQDVRGRLIHTEAMLKNTEEARDEAVALWKEVEQFKQSGRWRLAQRLGAPLDRLRRRGRR